MLEGLIEHVRPEGDTDVVRPTTPVKPDNGETVRVEFPYAPAWIVKLVGLVVNEKSVMFR